MCLAALPVDLNILKKQQFCQDNKLKTGIRTDKSSNRNQIACVADGDKRIKFIKKSANILSNLDIIHRTIQPLKFHQFVMRTILYNAAFIQHKNIITIFDSS